MDEGPFKAGAWVTGQSWHLSGEWQTGFFIGLVRHGDGNSYAQIANATGTDLVIVESLRLAPTPDCTRCSGASVDPVETHHQAMPRIFADGFAAIAAAIRGEKVT
jgi:hypothetical protein